MRWEGRRQSTNVEDRRRKVGPVAVGGGLMALLLFVGLMFLGVDPKVAQKLAGAGAPAAPAQPGKIDPREEKLADFTKVVLADTEDVWGRLFPAYFNARYRPPTLVMFTGRVGSACGLASAAVGPFYCPLDEKVYVDLSFYDELQKRFGAPGDFAQAYVIGHEVGHHVQKLLGIADKVQAERSRMPKTQANKLSVRMELQADFLAGVWAHHLAKYKGVIDEDDVREALNAAAAIGDDRIQKKTQGYVVPDAFTHGTGEQRVRWFLYGFKEGDPKLMDRAFQVDEP